MVLISTTVTSVIAGDRRGPVRDLVAEVEQLAETAAAANGVDRRGVDRYVDLAFDEQIEALARVAFADDHGPLGIVRHALIRSASHSVTSSKSSKNASVRSSLNFAESEIVSPASRSAENALERSLPKSIQVS